MDIHKQIIYLHLKSKCYKESHLPRKGFSENAFTSWLSRLDFEYWSSSQHKIMPTTFLEKRERGEAILLDVRTEVEAKFLSLPFAFHIPINQLPKRLDEIPRDKLIATFCAGGDRANVAFSYLHAEGFKNVRILKGGYSELTSALVPKKLQQLLYGKA